MQATMILHMARVEHMEGCPKNSRAQERDGSKLHCLRGHGHPTSTSSSVLSSVSHWPIFFWMTLK
jgi:hypothetical protein